MSANNTGGYDCSINPFDDSFLNGTVEFDPAEMSLTLSDSGRTPNEQGTTCSRTRAEFYPMPSVAGLYGYWRAPPCPAGYSQCGYMGVNLNGLPTGQVVRRCLKNDGSYSQPPTTPAAVQQRVNCCLGRTQSSELCHPSWCQNNRALCDQVVRDYCAKNPSDPVCGCAQQYTTAREFLDKCALKSSGSVYKFADQQQLHITDCSIGNIDLRTSDSSSAEIRALNQQCGNTVTNNTTSTSTGAGAGVSTKTLVLGMTVGAAAIVAVVVLMVVVLVVKLRK